MSKWEASVTSKIPAEIFRDGLGWEVRAAGFILGKSYASATCAWMSAARHLRCTEDWHALLEDKSKPVATTS